MFSFVRKRKIYRAPEQYEEEIRERWTSLSEKDKKELSSFSKDVQRAILRRSFDPWGNDRDPWGDIFRVKYDIAKNTAKNEKISKKEETVNRLIEERILNYEGSQGDWDWRQKAEGNKFAAWLLGLFFGLTLLTLIFSITQGYQKDLKIDQTDRLSQLVSENNEKRIQSIKKTYEEYLKRVQDACNSNWQYYKTSTMCFLYQEPGRDVGTLECNP